MRFFTGHFTLAGMVLMTISKMLGAVVAFWWLRRLATAKQGA